MKCQCWLCRYIQCYHTAPALMTSNVKGNRVNVWISHEKSVKSPVFGFFSAKPQVDEVKWFWWRQQVDISYTAVMNVCNAWCANELWKSNNVHSFGYVSASYAWFRLSNKYCNWHGFFTSLVKTAKSLLKFWYSICSQQQTLIRVHILRWYWCHINLQTSRLTETETRLPRPK